MNHVIKKALRCLTYRHILIGEKNTHCWLCAGHYTIYGGKKEVAA